MSKMRKIVLAGILAGVLLAAGCGGKSGGTRIPSLYNHTAEAESEKTATLALSFDFGDTERSRRTTADFLPFVAESQKKKISYVYGYLESGSDYEYFNTYNLNEPVSIRLKPGEYSLWVYAEQVEENAYYSIFSGEKKIIVSEGENRQVISLELENYQPITIALPFGETIADCLELRELDSSWYSYYFCPSPDGTKIIGAIRLDNKSDLTLEYGGRIYVITPEMALDALIFSQLILLDQCPSKKITAVGLEVEIEPSQVVAGSTGNVVLTFKVSNESDINASISSFEFDFEGAKENLLSVTLMTENLTEVNDTELGTAPVSETVVFTPATPIVVEARKNKIFWLKTDISLNAQSGDEFLFRLRNIGSETLLFEQVGSRFAIASNGTLVVHTIKIDPRIVLAGSTGNHFLGLEFSAKDEDFELKSLAVAIDDGDYCGEEEGDYKDVRMVFIYGDSHNNIIAKASIPSTGEYIFNFPPKTIFIPKNTQTYLFIAVTMSTIDPDQNDAPGTPNADVKIKVGDIKATGLSSHQSANVIENIESSAMILRNSMLYIESSSVYDTFGAGTVLTNGNFPIYATEIRTDASGKDALLYKLTYEAKVSEGVQLSEPYLTSEHDEIISRGEWIFSDGKYTASFYFDNPDFESGLEKEAIRIPAGESETFRLWTTVSGVSTGDYLSTRLIGDNGCAPMGTADEIAVNSNFVWSDNHQELSITSSENNAIATEQWYNGDLLYVSDFLYIISN